MTYGCVTLGGKGLEGGVYAGALVENRRQAQCSLSRRESQHGQPWPAHGSLAPTRLRARRRAQRVVRREHARGGQQVQSQLASHSPGELHVSNWIASEAHEQHGHPAEQCVRQVLRGVGGGGRCNWSVSHCAHTQAVRNQMQGLSVHTCVRARCVARVFTLSSVGRWACAYGCRTCVGCAFAAGAQLSEYADGPRREGKSTQMQNEN